VKRVLGIIPSRYLSSRFPGKPLADIAGKSMIRRVYDQCLKSGRLTDVVVATDDTRIYKEVVSGGGRAVLVQEPCNTGTERCIKAYHQLKNDVMAYDAVLNIQGDEPFINPRQIDQLVDVLISSDDGIATLVKKIDIEEEITDSNIVKVVFSSTQHAMYFSRSPIPFVRDPDTHITTTACYKHIGIYAFRTSVIENLESLQQGQLEVVENLEQLRWLESDYKIKVAVTPFETVAIDTPEDLEKAKLLIQTIEKE
jgi:3-deoxy-manno-octulosonate cytidylyltransferase (CMP-KDO synthetase)